MKRWIALILALLLCCTLSACGGSGAADNHHTVSFTDSCGRTVEVPARIDKIAVTGSMAQIIVFALAPDKLVGVAGEWSEAARPYIAASYLQLPVLGQLYGGKGELNPETLLASGAQLVIDVGESKSGLAGELGALQAQTGLPVVHIDARLSALDETYTLLGQLLDMEQEAEILSRYCRSVYDRAADIASHAQKVRLLYLLGDEGCRVITRDSYFSEVIDLMSLNAAVADSPTAKGTGSEVDLEQILLWDPDYIIFAPGSIYDTAAADPAWQQLSAVAEGRFCQVPEGPYNWMGFPPSAQQLLGMIWLGYTLYPDVCGYDLYDEVAQYFRLFYHTELTQAQFEELMQYSTM